MKRIQAIVLGYGNRGKVYCCYANKDKNFEVIGVIDTDKSKRDLCAKDYNLTKEKCFSSVDEFLERDIKADVVLVCTPDDKHFNESILLLEKGYDLLLEKPISIKLNECIAISEKANELKRTVIVGHVLRYTVFFQKIKELLDKKIIGKIIQLNQIENIGYWHFAHSYVRGNWKNSNTSSPIILAKCCHDLDLISWLIDDECEKISSFGELTLFRRENKPKNSSDRCIDCTIDCPYNAYNYYYKKKFVLEGNSGWPVNVITTVPTHESVIKSLNETDYGKCVYACENNVPDHQIVNMQYKSGVTASLSLCAFTDKTYRELKIMGTHGEIIANMDTNIITVNIFAKESYEINVNNLSDDFSFHAGGDHKLMSDLVKLLNNEKTLAVTSIAKSIESHKMAFAAEESRLNGGNTVFIK